MAEDKIEHPMQPLIVDEDGIIRFKANKIIRHLVDSGAISLNDIDVSTFHKEDVEQFWQLLGYSVSGFGDLDFVRRETVERADALAEALDQKRRIN